MNEYLLQEILEALKKIDAKLDCIAQKLYHKNRS